MKALKGNFKTHSPQDWLQKAEKDLKGKSLEDLSWTWDDTLSFAPAYFDAPDTHFKVPAQTNAWTISEPFVVDSPTQTNKEILEALHMGAEHISVTISTPLSEMDWGTLLDKVVLSYIHFTVNIKGDIDSIHGLDSYLQTVEWSPDQLFLLVNREVQVPIKLTSCRRVASDIHIDTDDSAKQLSQQMRQAEQLLQTTKEAKQLVFNLHLSKSFYHNIAWIQAVKILWQNILDAYQMDPNLPIHLVAHIQDHDQLDENTQKINATIQAISAVVCGVHSLVIHPQTISDQSFERRINRNIQHLMKLESYMDQVMNPTEGAYYFEHLTKELAECAWSHFQDLD